MNTSSNPHPRSSTTCDKAFANFIEAYGEPRELRSRKKTGFVLFAEHPNGNTVVCYRRATHDALRIEDVAALLRECDRSGAKPRFVLVSFGGGVAPHSQRRDLHLVESLVARKAVTRVVWSSVDAISRSIPCAAQHLYALGSHKAQVRIAEHGFTIAAWNLVMHAPDRVRLLGDEERRAIAASTARSPRRVPRG